MSRAKVKPRTRIDWDAVERDFRTGKFSQVELCAKHSIAEATLSRKIKSDQKADATRWQRDLAEAVRQATNAAVLLSQVKRDVKAGQESGAILAAAELGKQVILQHRGDISKARAVAVSLLTELEGSEDKLNDRIGGAKALAETLTKLQAAERKAFNLDTDQPPPPPPNAGASVTVALEFEAIQKKAAAHAA